MHIFNLKHQSKHNNKWDTQATQVWVKHNYMHNMISIEDAGIRVVLSAYQTGKQGPVPPSLLASGMLL